MPALDDAKEAPGPGRPVGVSKSARTHAYTCVCENNRGRIRVSSSAKFSHPLRVNCAPAAARRDRGGIITRIVASTVWFGPTDNGRNCGSVRFGFAVKYKASQPRRPGAVVIGDRKKCPILRG